MSKLKRTLTRLALATLAAATLASAVAAGAPDTTHLTRHSPAALPAAASERSSWAGVSAGRFRQADQRSLRQIATVSAGRFRQADQRSLRLAAEVLAAHPTPTSRA